MTAATARNREGRHSLLRTGMAAQQPFGRDCEDGANARVG